jgi:acyl-CoA synthetase (AMP-forming)/AMP-acid ligase II
MTPTPNPPGTLTAAVRHWAATIPDAPALTFVDYTADRAGLAVELTFADLDRRSRAMAATLAASPARGHDPDARVAVMCPQGPEFVVAYLACLYSGALAVPLPVPTPYRDERGLSAIIADSDPAVVLTTVAAREAVAPLLSGRELLCMEEIPDAAGHGWSPAEPPASGLAYLQYTSGSTRVPTGVRVTHANLMAGVRQIHEQTEVFGGRSVVLSWLPYFHDMGLICGIAMPLAAGAHAVHLSATAFLKQPYRWLRLATDYRASWSATPNFGYDLCVRRISAEQRRSLDLGSLHTLCNGSEQVRAASLARFQEAFGPCGLRPIAHAPGYGLAEATLAVTSAMRGAQVREFDRAALSRGRAVRRERDPAARKLVSCGTPLPGIEVSIVDLPSLTVTGEGELGEIWVRGPNVADGYWRRPELSAEIFGGHPAGDPDGRPWLRTGDCGFLSDGELYIAGRLKDTIVVDGRNHYPADLEVTVEQACAGLRVGGAAAFAVDDEERERLVIALEIAGTVPPGLSVEVRRAVSAGHDLGVDELVVVSFGSLPRTTSGKIRRAECRDRYLAGTLRRAGVPAMTDVGSGLDHHA